jgi:hypothetical protein
MAAFMDESGVVTRDVQFYKRGNLRSNSTPIISHQSLFPHPQSPGHQRHISLPERYPLVSNCEAYSDETATDNRIERGGDAVMR